MLLPYIIKFSSLLKETFQSFVSFLRSFTKDGRFRLTQILYYLGILALAYYVIYITFYGAYYIPRTGHYYIDPKKDFTLFGYEQLWNYRAAVTRMYNWYYIKYAFWSSEKYDWSYAGVYWLMPFKTFLRFIKESYWLYAFHGWKTITSYKGTLSWMHAVNPIVRLPFMFMTLLQEYKHYYYDTWSSIGSVESGMLKIRPLKEISGLPRLSRAMTYKSYPNYLKELAFLNYKQGDFVPRAFAYLSMFTNSFFIYTYIVFHHTFFIVLFVVKSILFICCSATLLFSTVLLALGVGSIATYLFYKITNSTFFLFWIYDYYLSGWELKVVELLPTILYGSMAIFLALFFGIATILGFIFLPMSIVDHIIYLSLGVYRIGATIFYRVTRPRDTLTLIWLFIRRAILFVRNLKFVWADVKMLNAWGKREIARGMPIIGLIEDLGFRSQRTGRTIVVWVIPVVITYILWHYKLWFDSLSMFVVEDLSNYYYKQSYGYPQRFMLDTYWQRDESSTVLVRKPVYSLLDINWPTFNYKFGRAFVNRGEYNPLVREPDFFHRETITGSTENYEFYRFIVLPTFLCVLPCLILIFMSRKIRVIVWAYYDTLTVVFWSFFFFYVFGSLTIGYSFFLRLWFDFVFQELHEGPLYDDIINSDPVDTRMTVHATEHKQMIIHIDTASHYMYFKRGFNVGQSYYKSNFIYENTDKGILPDNLPKYDSPYTVHTRVDCVESIKRWCNYNWWAKYMCFHEYGNQDFMATIDEVHALPPYVRYAKDRKFMMADSMKKLSSLEIIQYRMRFKELYGDTLRKQGFPKAFTWDYNAKRNREIDEYYRLNKAYHPKLNNILPVNLKSYLMLSGVDTTPAPIVTLREHVSPLEVFLFNFTQASLDLFISPGGEGTKAIRMRGERFLGILRWSIPPPEERYWCIRKKVE